MDEVDDYSLYPIAENASPGLSADRLEYTMANTYSIWREDLRLIAEIYGDIAVLTNEKGESEL